MNIVARVIALFLGLLVALAYDVIWGDQPPPACIAPTVKSTTLKESS